MPQGKFKQSAISKPKSKPKPVRGDQQKLKRGNHVIKPKAIHHAKAAEFAVQQKISKQINQRIEDTMTARTGGDGGGTKIVKESSEGAELGRSLTSSSFSAKQKK